MTATWTNPETGRSLNIFVHGIVDQHGEQWARVNKGEAKTPASFLVRLAHTNVVLA